MPEKKNALMELANNIDIVKQGLSELNEDNDLVLSDKAFVILGKAQRIVAELANRNISLIPQECYGCGVLKTIANCRAIAEEGGAK